MVRVNICVKFVSMVKTKRWEVIRVFTVNRKEKVEYDSNSGISFSSVKVYNVRDDKNGYPHFLIYENREWKYVSAKRFIPDD